MINICITKNFVILGKIIASRFFYVNYFSYISTVIKQQHNTMNNKNEAWVVEGLEAQFNYKEITCNGVGGSGYQSVLKHKDQIQSICQEVRDLLGDRLFDKMVAQAQERDMDADFHTGRRYSSVEDNAYRLITGIAKHVWSYLPNEHLAEMHVGAVLPMLTIDEKVYMVLDALRDCASADHWYTYEKDWG